MNGRMLFAFNTINARTVASIGFKMSERWYFPTIFFGFITYTSFVRILVSSIEYRITPFDNSKYITSRTAYTTTRTDSIAGFSDNPNTSLDNVTFDEAKRNIARMKRRLLAMEKRASLWKVPQKPSTVAEVITVICIIKANPRLPDIIYQREPSSGETMNVRSARAISTP